MQEVCDHIKKAKEIFAQNLSLHIPEEAISCVVEHFFAQPTKLKVTPERKSIEGTYIAPHAPHYFHTITINNNLNKYAFLFTLMHEIAHMKVWIANIGKPTPKSHGTEWKQTFDHILADVMNCFPADIAVAIEKYKQNVPAATCRDEDLYKLFRQYDTETPIFLDDVPIGTIFKLKDYEQTFQKIKKLRKHYVCLDIKTQKNYKVSALAKIELIING